MMAVFWHSLQREVLHVYRDRWDAGLLVWAPLAVLLLLGWMFMAGVPRQLPIAVIDDDHSTFSRLLIRQLERSPSLSVPHIDTQWSESLARLQRLEVWGIVHIPAGAEAHLRQGEGAQISHVYNEAFYSLGGSVAAGVRSVVTQTTRDSLLENAHYRGLPVVDLHLPTVQVTPLFNPQTSYELFLEPLAVLAILHLILACAVVSAVGREVTTEGLGQWLGHAPTWTQLLGGLLGKVAPYLLMMMVWTVLWMGWLAGVRGWTIQGSVALLLAGQALLYSAYALIAAWVMLQTRDMATAFSIMAIYAGSSLSFADVTLPTLGAPWFTRLWSQLLPYTAYARLQMEQWVMGSAVQTSLIQLGRLGLFFGVALLVCLWLLYRMTRPAPVPAETTA